MASTTSMHDVSHATADTADGNRLRRAGRRVKLVVGLIAIYGPPALVLQLHRKPLGKIYLVIGIWAIEGILWSWLDGRALDRRRGQDVMSWSA
jgi:hypothetical protein